MNREPTVIDRSIPPALKAVARSAPYFTKSEVVHGVLRRRDLAGAVKGLRQQFPGYGFDELILRYIDTEVGKALQARDSRGIRLYECYSTGNGQRRWRTLRSMTRGDLEAVVFELVALREQIDAKVKVYEAFIAELGRRGADATVEDVYDSVTRRMAIAVAEKVAS